MPVVRAGAILEVGSGYDFSGTVGSGVKHLKEGDRTVVPYPSPAWAERIKADARPLRPLPSGDINQFAMLSINPATAYLLLTLYAKLAPGSWVPFVRWSLWPSKRTPPMPSQNNIKRTSPR